MLTYNVNASEDEPDSRREHSLRRIEDFAKEMHGVMLEKHERGQSMCIIAALQLDRSLLDASNIGDLEKFVYISRLNIVKYTRGQKLGIYLIKFVIKVAGNKTIYTR